jgi:photosystem II stability/assembly factor-like uncharacterized protein
MAKAGLLYVGTDDGLVLFSEPGAAGRWLRVGHVLRGELVRAVWASAESPLLVLAGTATGLYGSADGGQTWEAGLAQPVVALAGERTAPQTVYLTTQAGDLYRSDDAGVTWARGEPGAWPAGAPALPAPDPADAHRVYVAVGAQVWSSGDGGVSWARYGEGLPAPAERLLCGPGQAGVLYALAEGLHRCGHATAAWEHLGGAGGVALAGLAGKEPVLLLADAGGVSRSPDEGATWEPGAPDAPWSGGVTALAAALYHIDTAFAGSAGGQVAISADRGRTWQMLRQDLPPVRALVAARLV